MPPPSFSVSGPMTVADCEHLAAQLLDPSVAVELRDSAETARDFGFYEKYLGALIPSVCTVLGDERTISFTRDNLEQRLRHTLLSFIQRLPHHEPLRPHVAKIMELMIKLLKVENEENAMSCIKIMIDGIRSHKEQAEPLAEQFLDLVKQMYANIKSVVEKEFGPPSTITGPSSSPVPVTPGSDTPFPQAQPTTPAPTVLARSLYSPKVLTECPIAVVLIFQTFKSIMQGALLDFYPLVLESIKLQPEPQRLAHLEAKERGETFTGVTPAITNREVYTELIKAQVKTMAFVAYILRGAQNVNVKDYLEVFPEACIRLLRDCPPEDVGTRKELLVATRHILSAESRSAFIPYIDTLLEEKVLVGSGVSSRETLRPLAYSVVADLIHHVRNELPMSQLSRVVYVFSCNLNDASFSGAIQTMCAKLLNTLVDSIISKGEPTEASRILRGMFFTALEKLRCMTETYDRLKAIQTWDKAQEQAKEEGTERKDQVDVSGDVSMTDIEDPADKQKFGWRFIEQSMPVYSVAYAKESLEAFCKEARYLFKTLLHTIRTLLAASRSSGQDAQPMPPPDGEMLGEFFRHALRCLAIFEGQREPRESKDAVELVDQILLMFEPHVFAEIWTLNMDFFVEQATVSLHVFPVLQTLITHESVSHQLVAILLKYLMAHLGDLGHESKAKTSICLRLFKMSFLAINTYIASNESVLVPHLQKLIMESFEHAAKADDPAIYYQILRALFRSIGGGRFEALYKEVLPILHEMLDTLAYLLQHTSDTAQRDLFVELTLTVPVRLTNLLPYLSYLMKPLVHALHAGPELISQGLRTLELCIDNLTGDFLDPTMTPIHRDLMIAMQALLKPIPANRQHAGAAVKILGKLGGRNRRFHEVDHDLQYWSSNSRLLVPISFKGKTGSLPLSPLVQAATSALHDSDALYQDEALQALMLTSLTVFETDAPNPEGNDTFQETICGLVQATQQEAIAEKAIKFIRSFCSRMFTSEINRSDASPGKFSHESNRKRLLPLTSAFFDSFVFALAQVKESERPGIISVLVTLVNDLRGMSQNTPSNHSPETARVIQTLLSRLVTLCQDEDWSRKMAGVNAITAIMRIPDISRQILIDLEIELVRAFMFCLRDAPKHVPRSADKVKEAVIFLLRTCQGHDEGKVRIPRLVDCFITELNGQNELSRSSTREFISLLAELTAQPILNLIQTTVKARLLDPQGAIFSKPLRAIAMPMQVGNIDAMTYIIELRPPLVETTEEFVRMLHEVLALADVDDPAPKSANYKDEVWLKRLRISCLKLLNATMACPELLSKPHVANIRSKIIQVYFKHVYSTNSPTSDIAHDGLREVLSHQSKLPKDVLQTGLRPILVNLADARRLSVTGLEGLGRFLELLTNYFKVEIGVKLLDHLSTLGDHQMLAEAARDPLDDNTDIARMTRLVNIFRLLPSTGVQFLKSLTSIVVDVEAQLHQSSPGPFTVSLGRYLDRYHVEAAQNLLDNISHSRYIWTYRCIIMSDSAPLLVEQLSNNAEAICEMCFKDPDNTDLVIPGLYLIRELSRKSPSWLAEREPVLSALVVVWRSILEKSRNSKINMTGPHYQVIPTLILEMFMTALRYQHIVPLLFHVVEAFEIRSSFEKSFVSFFLYEQAALQDSVEYRREVIEHFLNIYEDPSVTWAFKTNALRVIVNPTIRTYFADDKQDGSLITHGAVQKIASLMWQPLGATAAARALDDTTLIEIFVLTTLLVHHCSVKVSDVRKHVFKLAWMGINLLEPTVKLTAYVLTARFMSTFDTPFKFVRLTWIGVLRLKDTENRTLFRQATDILAACLPIRDPPTVGTPEWAQRLRAILVEDGPATGQVVSVCELLVNHADLFYDYRELYVPQIANSLSKLAFAAASTPELRKLTIDIVELIFRWEKRRMAARDEAMDVDEKRTLQDSPEAASSKRHRLDRAGTVVSASSGGGWAAPSQVREMMTSHLMRFVSSAQESSTRNSLVKRALNLFKEMLGPKGLPNVQVKLSFFHRTLGHDITPENINQVANSTEVIAAVAAVKDRNWVKTNLALLTKLLEKVWMFDDSTLHETVKDLTEQMLKEMPEDENAEADADSKALLAVVQNAVTEGLAAGLRSSSHVPGTIFLLDCWLKAQPKQLQNDAISSGLLKVLANLVKIQTATGAPESAHRLIISILDLLRDRVADLREQRKHLQSVLSTLIERSTNLVLCRYLLDLIRHWVLDDPEPTSQGKEKAALLMRMTSFDQRDDALFQSFLEVVYQVYEVESLRGSDITHRLEPAFLLGTRSKDPAQRARFLGKLEQSLPTAIDARLQALFSIQNWDVLADFYFIPEILTLLLGVARTDDPCLKTELERQDDDDMLADLATTATTGDLFRSLSTLAYLSSPLAHHAWVTVFPLVWSCLSRQQQIICTPHIVKLLSKESLRKQAESRTNVVQTFLAGFLPCSPPIALPPTLIKYLAKTFNAWYIGFELLSGLTEVFKGDDALRESCTTSLAELYADLNEDDMFYGLARGRCAFVETTAALTYEQNGRWQQAMEMYEQAQTKARNSLLPFSEEEYCLWEDHWILAAQKLQNWDWLLDLGRVDNDADLLLECAWRLSDWTSPDRETFDQNIAKVIDVPTPRRKTFEAYSALLKAHAAREPPNDFLRILDETQQVSLRKWVSLPTHITPAHIPLLQQFQQCVELAEAASVFDSLSMTNAANLEVRVNGDLKQIFHTWRDRLPNFYDDINIWSDMLAWRNHVFQAVTKVYVPLIPSGETGTFGYRGYHETAWMINRFGEVARRHGLLDVCSIALNKIYSLPNIEISEAFLKLREQALCFFQKPDKFNDGLENISTTNLMYFAPAQKAEFLTLKGMFISRLGQDEEANAEFAHAIQMDMGLPMAWAEWGKFNDKLYRDRPETVPGPPPEPEPGKPKLTEEQYASMYARDRAVLASSAVSCYLQAAGTYNNHKSRALLLRVLWLLGLDDSHATISRAFENYKGDLVIWYWLTLIPQLLMSLSHREAKHARLILTRIAKQHPQALFYSLRVTREDFSSHKRQQAMLSRSINAKKAMEASKAGNPASSVSGDGAADSPNPDSKDSKDKEDAVAGTPSSQPNPAPTPTSGNLQVPGMPGQSMAAPRQPLDLVEEIMNLLKTTYPLLALTMEKMVDQISLRAKPSSEEDIYRFFAALLNDAMQQWGGRNGLPNDDGELNQATKDNLSKFANNLTGDLKASIEVDFMKDMPKLREYIKRLQFWRDSYEKSLDARPRAQPIDQGGCNLLDFHHTRFDEVEVPGQYVQHVDQTEELVKIARFSSKAELGRGHGHCFRRVIMIGSNGATYTWNVQLPAARHCRREERLTQLFRIMNSVMKKRVETRRRNLQFHLPTAVALAPQLRLVQNDSSYVSLQDIYDDYCNKQGMSRENSIMAVYDRMKLLHDPTMSRTDPRFLQLKIEVMDEIQAKMVPETILTNYMIKTMNSPDSLWLMRKQFALQTATVMFLTYVCSLSNRTPSRFHLSRRSGLMYMTEILPAFANGRAIIESNESVPFRLTPNMQHFITRVGIEGIVTSAVTAIGRSLTMPEFDLSGSLSLFIRDEVLTWTSTYSKDAKTEAPITQTVYKNVDAFIRRASLMGYLGENKDKTPMASPAVHLIVQLISQATAPLQLAQMNENFMAWY
ncbi:hypothetical protein TREMEDRAFT_71446 [Tremella mesenterica DSM 1558]|uniref:uncharacterized protein n=1 Tax=Tremella mesenterica (strain ATCC 24925 / CBS 8224 / DSM 1558 / NBRC 9311 / NRRL Y-6157 / RJB 2259-6 / UBC 559-6) TaxID=578456 RepID=UPI0003F48D48|nr:uncharacterized protein TREMEDRAFT_71446 [Tremella mesenterica DSM 1558]EIW69900.1 hypothetical protein TREMEDRAFT_71446 [Tremella mesenterica DSM 1558]